MNNYDRIAWCYDWLKQLIFGDRLDQASQYFLSDLRPGSSLLILGGGTGKILEYIPQGVEIHYLEKSGKMIQRTQKRVDRKINFIQADFLTHETEQKYDYILCPFFLDTFNQETLELVVNRIKKLLKRNGVLLVSDFTGKQPSLVPLMYMFFRLTTRIQANSLPQIHREILEAGFTHSKSMDSSTQMFFSHCYRK